MADIGWRRGSSPAARTGARPRAGLTPAPASNTLSCQRETLHSQQLRSIKKSIDSDHGIYRDHSRCGGLPPELLGPGSRMLRLGQYLRQSCRRRLLNERPAEPIGRLHKACHVLAR